MVMDICRRYVWIILDCYSFRYDVIPVGSVLCRRAYVYDSTDAAGTCCYCADSVVRYCDAVSADTEFCSSFCQSVS